MVFWGEFSSVGLGLILVTLGVTIVLPLYVKAVWMRISRRRAAAYAAETLPFPVWVKRSKDAPDTAPEWANAAFFELSAEDQSKILLTSGRLKIGIGAEVQQFQRQSTGETFLLLPCDDLARAEDSLRDVLQMMTQTFAQLPLGVAVFDKAGHLTSFNPVFVELAGLSPAFLTRRPSLTAMLDAMRDRSMVPEPANWKNWRATLTNREQVASKAAFEDVWALPGGQTYRVMGRRHRGGGLALMIEDISPEILRGRRYRARLDLCQAVIDRMDEAVAVFAASGQLVLSNLAYAALWGHDPAAGSAKMDLRQVAGHWRNASAPTTLWAELEAFGDLTEDRRAWQGEARLIDGRLIRCRCEPMRDGAMLVGFHTVPTEGPMKTALVGRG